MFSNRTSVHVHLNVSDLTIEEWFTLLFIWTAFEDSFLQYCGPDRTSNLFCLSSKDAEGMLFTLEEFASTGHIHTLGDNVRYAACNLSATPKYGSLEFRCMGGTTDSNVLIPWFTTIASLYGLAKQYGTPEKFMDHVVNTSYNIFPKDHFVYSIPNWKQNLKERLFRLSLVVDLCNWDVFNFIDEPRFDI